MWTPSHPTRVQRRGYLAAAGLAACFGPACDASSDARGPAGPATRFDASDAPVGPRRPPRTRGGAVVVTRDQRTAVVCQRTTGRVEVHKLSGAGLATLLSEPFASLDLGSDSEPWAAVIGADDDTAYVLLRRARAVATITGLKTTPVLSEARAPVGSEPTAIAIQPSGHRLFVSNFADGTLSVLNVSARQRDLLTPELPLDLNCALAGSCGAGAPGPPARAHPRGLYVTDDGDDSDVGEVLYASEFFGQPRDGAAPSELDVSREGVVYALRFDTAVPVALRFGPIADTGYEAASPDGDGGVRHAPTGCYPNQLSAIAQLDSRLMVAGMCTSPAGPVGAVGSDPSNFKALLHPALFVLDRESGQPLSDQHALLDRAVDDAFDADLDAGIAGKPRRMPLIPSELVAPDPSGDTLCLSAYGADAVFCTRWDERGLRDVGAPGVRAFETSDCQDSVPHLPIGLAFLDKPERAMLVAHDDLGTLAVLDAGGACQQSLASQANRAADSRSELVRKGRRKFVTGLGVWSYGGEARASCEGCHPDGWSDGVVWEFSRGPRRTLSLAGTFDDDLQRALLWTASADELADLESVVRGTLGGVGGVIVSPYHGASEPPQRVTYDKTDGTAHSPWLLNGLNGALGPFLGHGVCMPGACASTQVDDWLAIEAYAKTLRAPMACSLFDGSDAAQVERGQQLFERGRCAFCHGGPGFCTPRLRYRPSSEMNGALPWPRPTSIDPEMFGALRLTTFALPSAWQALSPAARSTGSATLRSAVPGELDALYAPSLEDALQCALRDVGTYPAAGATIAEAVHPAHAPALLERRLDGAISRPAIGAAGFNPPSLLGMSVGAPYFHAGNARTLSEVFDPAFAAHHQALVPGFLGDPATRDAEVAALVRYLLSLDDTSATPAPIDGGDFCSSGLARIAPTP